MLIPDSIHPQQTIYYNGSIVLKTLQENPSIELFNLFEKIKMEKDMRFPVFMLCLDWLYLIDLITLNDKGIVSLCI